MVRRALQYADVVKLNEEEIDFLGGDAPALWEDLREGGLRALVLTEASAGARVFFAGGVVHVEAPDATGWVGELLARPDVQALFELSS